MIDDTHNFMDEKMDWLKKHADTIAVLGVFAVCFWTLNEKIEDRFQTLTHQISSVDKDVTVIKTVLMMKNIMPTELCHAPVEEKHTK